MKEPLSIYSNIAFLLAAVGAAITHPASSAAFVLAMTVVAVASFAFHLQGSKEGTKAHFFDEASIYLVVAVLLYYGWGSHTWALVPLVGMVGYSVFHLERINSMKVAPVGMAAVVVGVAVTVSLEAAMYPLFIGLIAGLVRFRSPNTDAWHALWHLLIAASGYAAWLVTV